VDNRAQLCRSRATIDHRDGRDDRDPPIREAMYGLAAFGLRGPRGSDAALQLSVLVTAGARDGSACAEFSREVMTRICQGNVLWYIGDLGKLRNPLSAIVLKAAPRPEIARKQI
jgi:hypothetical protein